VEERGMERVTGFSVLEEMERLRASRIEEGLVPVWLPADDVEAWVKAEPSGEGHWLPRVVHLVDACREALEGRS